MEERGWLGDDIRASSVLFNFYPSTVYKRKDQQSSPQSEIALDGKRGISEKRKSSPARTSHKPVRVLQHRHETRTVRNREKLNMKSHMPLLEAKLGASAAGALRALAH